MEKNKDKTKCSHSMGLRLDQDTYLIIEKLSQELDIKKSTLLKKALKGWATIRSSVNFENMVVIGKPMLKFFMKTLEEDQAIELASIVSNNVCSMIANKILENQNVLSTDAFLNFFVSGMGNNGKGWFDKVQVQKIEENTYRLLGTHQFGKNFSIFIFHMITKMMENIGQFITKQDLNIKSDKLVSILILRIDSLQENH